MLYNAAQLLKPRRPRRATPPPAPAPRLPRWKAGLDFGAALVLLLLTAPVVLAAALLVRLTSRGPALYSQVRVGHNGRPFTLYKLRSMYADCERASGACWSPKGDPRVTPVGRFLRATHLDELPQLWNVLRGDMSLVGPRPERPEFLPGLAQRLPRYRERLAVRPGLTGLAQVQLPPDTDVTGVRRKLAHDLYYAERVGFWLDCRILAATALKVLHAPFPVTRRLVPGVTAAYADGPARRPRPRPA